MPPRGWKSTKEIGYWGYHARVYREHGRAARYTCSAACGNPAAHWACLGEYANLEDYVPLCCSCHKRFDLNKSGGMRPRDPSTLMPCGTSAAAQRHYAKGEPLCEECRGAEHGRYAREVKAATGRVARRTDRRLTDETVKEIRLAVALGMRQKAACLKYGVSPSRMSQLINRITYTEVD